MNSLSSLLLKGVLKAIVVQLGVRLQTCAVFFCDDDERGYQKQAEFDVGIRFTSIREIN